MNELDDSDFLIPRNLEAPNMLLIWEMDSAVLYTIILVLFSVLTLYFTGLTLAFYTTRGYGYLKEEGGRGLVVKLLYWYTPLGMWISSNLPSHVREYYGA